MQIPYLSLYIIIRFIILHQVRLIARVCLCESQLLIDRVIIISFNVCVRKLHITYEYVMRMWIVFECNVKARRGETRDLQRLLCIYRAVRFWSVVVSKWPLKSGPIRRGRPPSTAAVGTSKVHRLPPSRRTDPPQTNYVPVVLNELHVRIKSTVGCNVL